MKQYSFYNNDLLIDGERVTGFVASNAVISAGRNVPQHLPVIGGYGEMAVATTADLSGSFNFTLMQTADWNSILFAKAQLTQATGLSGSKSLWTPMQIQLVDKMGDLVATGVNGMILKQPTVVRGVGILSNLWSIFVERYETAAGQYPSIGN
ncbi:virion structural protein [Erwinia phage Faunus]|uniref:Tail tube protein n=1 Tax=Erwinia phage Faunus TaxID=2182346 RepID=A0A2U8UWZ1_9CAUD|nr:virion structural protein [Erwinia phage Faunus]AWN08644.1 hypothetical protein [Erwinia phage Faunus]